jgi:hypothetical protein
LTAGPIRDRQKHGWAESSVEPVIVDFGFSNFKFDRQTPRRKICLSIYRGAESEKAFGGKLLEQKRLRKNLRFLRRKKVGGG